jgi:peptidoglycan L-alanyl-D-glutamate endopeptidase CwlK
MNLLRRLFGWLVSGGSEAPPAPAAPFPGVIPVLTVGEAPPAPSATLTARDWSRLAGVHPDLVQVVARTRTAFPLFVIEGRRSLGRQRELLASGASRTLDSRHLTGHAVDLAPLPLDWNDLASFHLLAAAMKQAAADEGVPIAWGGDWRGFFDGPHFELPRERYPA